ncbi:MAG: endonuclease III [Chlamydiales bacterium]|nr:endonuclease III [Chlamydiales bacterium]
MKKSEKQAFILNILEDLYPNPPIPLLHENPYTLLIAVILSAQCTDKKVNEITPLLFKRANTPIKMSLLSVEEIQDIIRPCGLSLKKATSIKNLSTILVNEYKGNVPRSIEELERLPGVGHKTASVVMIQAFNADAFPVDTHIYRLAKRWDISKGKTVNKIEKDLKVFFPKNRWKKLHLQMIYFGREYCSARGHKKENCPICLLL